MTTDTQTPTRVSRNCANGKHGRCLGTVYTVPADADGARLLPCLCPVDGCGHGTETAKRARRA